MSTINQIASDLYKYLTEASNRKTKSYDTKAEVVRVDGTTAWVKIPGGIDETPVAKTNNANPGDQVMVRVSGGRAWLLGNETSPATDDTVAYHAVEQSNDAIDKANVAKLAADIAEAAADGAVASAAIARDVADAAVSNASKAETAAATAETRAENATNSANVANASATAAVYHLEEVEKVLDVLNWISQHGEYSLTNDEIIVAGKWYFSLSDGSYVVTTPISNPKTEGLYELNDIDDAVSTYISTHLYLDNSGLHIRNSLNNNHQIVISSNGISIVNNGVTVATYSNAIVLGDPSESHIELTSDYGLSFYQSAKIEESGVPINRIAYIQEDRLFINSATLTNNLQIGNFRWVVLPHRISLKYNPIT